MDIKDYEGHYQVSNKGRVKSLKNDIILATTLSNGYCRVNLSKDGVEANKRVRRLVMETFCPIDDMDTLNVYHIFGDRSDNRLKNLRWSQKKKNKYPETQGEQISGEGNGNAILSWEDVEYIRKNYKPRDPVFGRKPMAEKFRISERQINNIMNGKRWKV